MTSSFSGGIKEETKKNIDLAVRRKEAGHGPNKNIGATPKSREGTASSLLYEGAQRTTRTG